MARYRTVVDDVAGDSIVALIVLVSVIALGAVVWLTVKLVELFARVISRHHENTALRISGAIFGVLLVVTLSTTGHVVAIDWLTGLSLLALVAVAVVLDLEGRTSKPKPVDLQAVLTNPWWDD